MTCGLELAGPEAKGTVTINTAEQLLQFTKGEEEQMEKLIVSIKNRGVGCIVVNQSVSEIGLHYCNKYGILVLKVSSKFEIRRVCRALGAAALVKLCEPQLDDLGEAASIEVTEMSSKKVTVMHAKDKRVASIVLKGPTLGLLDEVERAIDDGLACVMATVKDARFLPGGGAIEIEIARELTKYAHTIPGLEQYAVAKFAEAFECIPKILATNAGHDATLTITELYAKHEEGVKSACVNGGIEKRVAEGGVLDHYATKVRGWGLAVEAVQTVLGVDQVVVARQAGGPKPPKTQNVD